MPKARDLTGFVYGRLTAISRVGQRGHNTVWRCRCACGTETDVLQCNLLTGNSTSCGCWLREMVGDMFRTHGDSGSREWRLWKDMLTRARNTRRPSAGRYSLRGIGVCKRWEKYENFIADMGRRPSPEHSLDRKNNDRGYSKANCRWATRSQQARNTSRNVLTTWKGETHCSVDWAEIFGVSRSAFAYRLKNWKKKDIFTQPRKIL